MKATLIRLVACLTELQVELISLETEEPNLERVFLHRTGRPERLTMRGTCMRAIWTLANKEFALLLRDGRPPCSCW